MRHLAHVERVTDIIPIERADSIEAARVLGWTIVVRKGDFSVGDLVVYVEPDSVIPKNHPGFEDVKVAKGRVKTRSILGQLSQGLILPVDNFPEISERAEGLDVTELIGITKYEEYQPVGNSAIIGEFDSRFAPKSDAERIQNLVDYWDIIRATRWVPTVKIDGTSRTLVHEADQFHLFSRNKEVALTDPGFNAAEKAGLLDLPDGYTAQFELVGPGVQGNRQCLPGQQTKTFAMYYHGEKLRFGDWPITPESVIRASDDYLPNRWETVDDLIVFISETCRDYYSPGHVDEGIVYHFDDEPAKALPFFDRNQNFKIINPEYLLAHKL